MNKDLSISIDAAIITMLISSVASLDNEVNEIVYNISALI